MNALIESITTAMGDQVLASILWKLRTGRAYTAIELASVANVAKGDIHSYLTQLIDAGLLTEIIRQKRGYYRLFSTEVAKSLRTYYKQTGMSDDELNEEHHPEGMKYCRTCYHHLAGEVGVKLTQELRDRAIIQVGEDTHFKLTNLSKAFFRDLNINTAKLKKKRSRFAKACIDFSERKYHLGGQLGKALFNEMEIRKWIARKEGTREIKITDRGKQVFEGQFNIIV